MKSQPLQGPCTFTAFSFLCNDTCHLSTVLMTDQDLLQLSWDYVTTITTFPTNSMKNSSFLASRQHPLWSSSVSETKRLWFLYCRFHPAKLRAKPCVCRIAFSCLLHNILPWNSVESGEAPKRAARMSEQMLIILLHFVSFYLQLYWHYILWLWKTYLMSFSPLPFLYLNWDWNLDSFY